jgi:hypothetical protein
MGRGTPSDVVGCGRKYGVRPIRILRDAVGLEMLKNRGRPASGVVKYDHSHPIGIRVRARKKVVGMAL